MNRKPLVMLIIVILVIQPLVAVSILGTHDWNTNAKVESNTIVAQQAGARLSPGDFTDHVPILIDEDADFVTQGWPGSGTESDPYVIAGLNITYNVGTHLITIHNTDLHFIIRDCLIINEGSPQANIWIENVTHGTLEYLTIASYYGGIYCFNADNTVIRNVALESQDLWGFTLQNSSWVSLSYNNFTSINKYTAIIAHCDNLASLSNLYRTDALETCVDVEYLEDSTFDQDTIVGGWVSLEMRRVGDTSITGLTCIDSNYALTIDESAFINVTSCDFSDGDYDAGTVRNSRNIRIIDSLFSSTNGWGLELFDTNNTDVIGNFINDTGIHGLGIVDCLHILLRDNHVGFAGDEGFELIDSVDVTIYSNTITETGEWGLALLGVDWGNVTANSITNTALQAVYSDTCNNGEFYNNFVNDTTNYGVHFNSAENWTLYDNEISYVHTGIYASSNTNLKLYRNSISHAINHGIHVTGSPDADIVNNTVREAETGLEVSTSSHRANVEGNDVQMNLGSMVLSSSTNVTATSNIFGKAYAGALYLTSLTDPVISQNIISDSEIGVQSTDTTGLVFQDNNMTNCGFYYSSVSSLDELNHTFANNFVNDKPLYYAFNKTGLSLDGNLYGEIILGNCNDSTINGGHINRSTGGILLYLSHRNTISGVHIAEEIFGVLFWLSDNNTLVDSTVEMSDTDRAVWLSESTGCTIHNVLVQDIDGVGIFVDNSFNATIEYCDFRDISDTAVAVEFDSSSDYSHALIFNNTFVNTTVGINGHSYSLSMNISHNEFMWCDKGIQTDYADFSHISSNYFHDNNWGMYSYNTYYLPYYNNTYYANNIGLHLVAGNDDVEVFYNIFLPNFINSAIDDGGTNTWDDNVDTGNYWYDFDDTIPWPIPGDSAVDRYPMGYDSPTEPIINTPIDIWIAEGSEGNSMAWIPFDDYLSNWVVEIDGVEWAADAWNFDNVTVNIDGLVYGTHTVSITVWDIEMNYVNDTVYVTVFDDTPPEIDGPPNSEFYVDADGQTLEWLVSDLNPATYTVVIGSIEFTSGTWDTGTLVIEVDDIEEGEHEIQITIFDVDGNSASDNVTVLVIEDDSAPTVDSPEDVVYVEGTTGNIIEWSPEDDYPDYYEVSFNGTTEFTGSWGGSRIAYTVDGLSPGTHEFQLTVYDSSGMSASDIVIVTVIPLQFTSPVEPVDWQPIIIVGGIIAIVAVVIGVVYYIRKKKTPSS